MHVGGGEPHQVEGADKVDVDDALEFGERHRSVAADDALGRPDTGAIDQDACGAELLARLPQRRARLLGIGDVALERVAADLLCQRAGAVEIDVDHRDLGAGAGKLARGRCAEAGGAAGHDRGMSLDVHD